MTYIDIMLILITIPLEHKYYYIFHLELIQGLVLQALVHL